MMNKFPTHAKLKKNSSHGKNYEGVWCPIIEIKVYEKQLSLVHPELGCFAWVSFNQVTFKTVPRFKLKLCEDCGEALVEKSDLCHDCLTTLDPDY